jgi:choline-phosphate cytidylyltransferase
MRMLEQAKHSLGDPARVQLIAGINTDEDTHRFKGKTVMDHKTRVDSVRHCKWVDEVIPEGPWIVTPAFLEKHNIDFVCHDALPYKDVSGQSEDGDVYSGLKKIGKFLETKRTEARAGAAHTLCVS